MKKQLYAMSLIMTSVFILLTACPSVEKSGADSAVVSGVSLNTHETTIVTGYTEVLTATVTPDTAENKKVTWTTSDSSTAYIIDDGNEVTVYSLSDTEETAVITVTTEDGGFTDTCIVTSIFVHVSDVDLPDEITVYIGTEEKLVPDVLPEEVSEDNMDWTNSNDLVATISEDSSDHSITITPVAAGDTVVTVTSVDGGYSDSCTVHVEWLPVLGVNIIEDSVTIGVGSSQSLVYNVLPANASDPSVSWSSDNESAATVDENGLVEAVGVGTATITLTSDDSAVTDICTVSCEWISVTGIELDITETTINAGDSVTITPTVIPGNASDRSVIWESSDTSVATVLGGEVKALSRGDATITATTSDGSFTASAEVEVDFNIYRQLGHWLDEETTTMFGEQVVVCGDYFAATRDYYGAGYSLLRAYERTDTNEWQYADVISNYASSYATNFWSVALDENYLLGGVQVSLDHGGGGIFLAVGDGAGSWTNADILISPSGDGATDEFSASIDISGDYIIGGAPMIDSVSDGNIGAAYIFHKTDVDTWGEYAELPNPDPEQSDYFGFDAAIDGDYAVIGAYRDDEIDTNAGAVYVFQRTGLNAWGNEVKLTGTSAKENDQFGSEVDISGDYIIVDNNNGTGVYIYHRTSANIWDSGVLLVDGDTGLPFIASSVAIDGDYAVAGYDYGNIVRLFQRTGDNSWEELEKIYPPDTDADLFGRSVDIDGNYIVIGAPGTFVEDVFFDNYDGAVYIVHIQ
ncbi:MAG: Ig-like domain-containing protein [Spirochaetales bacterium]|nr:Ig-like domain-containing protein [Spirochaetales bacterium]